MSSPFSKGTLYLKRKNRDLLAQLESNSAILQDRLQKLCKVARASTSQSPEQLDSTPVHSPLKRKRGYESWLARNNSGQVSAALNPNIFWSSTPSPSFNPNKARLMPRYVDEATTMSPAKRSKQYSDVHRERHGRTSATTPLISSKSTNKSKSRSRGKCPECYCQSSKQLPVPEKHGMKSSGKVCTACSASDCKKPHNSPASLGNSRPNVAGMRKTLEEARSLISYSPESVFLRGLKERSRVNLNEPETSSPEVDPTAITGHRPHNTRAREHSRQSANSSSFGVTNSTGKSKHSKPTSKRSSDGTGNATEKSERPRPTVKSPTSGVSNVTGKPNPSFRRGVSVLASQSGRRQDQSSKESTQPIANSSTSRRSTSASTRKFATNIASKNINAPSSRTHKPVSAGPKICRPVLARLLPTNTTSHKSTTLTNNRQYAMSSARHNPSPAEGNSRPRDKSYKHGSIAAAKDCSKTDSPKTTKAKLRAASSQPSSCRRNSRTSPTGSTCSSLTSSPTGRDFTGPPADENSRPRVKIYKHGSIAAATDRSKTDSPKTTKAKLRAASSQPSSGRRNLRTSPTGSTSSSSTSSPTGRDFTGPPANENSRPRVKIYKHGSIAAAKDHFKTDPKTIKAKLRASGKRNSKASPTVSTSSSPTSSPPGRDFEGPTKRGTRSKEAIPCPVQTRENCQPIIVSSSKKSRKKKSKCCQREESGRTRDLPARDVPSCRCAEGDLKTRPIVSAPCKKYKKQREESGRMRDLPARDVPSCRCAEGDLKTSPIVSVPCNKYKKHWYKQYCKSHCRKKSREKTAKNIPFNECYHKITSPTVPCCVSPHRECRRKSTRRARSCCDDCCCGDGEPAARRTQRRHCDGQEEWVDEIGRYRQSHWFDCHAHPTKRERSASSRARSVFRHGGVHRHMLNDRLFPTPLPCTNCCERCCGEPGDAETRPPQTFPREITLNTARNRDNVQVVLPQANAAKPKADEPNTGPFRIYQDPEKNTRGSRKSTGCMLTHPIYSKSLRPKFPVPANSLALRYQKGIV